MNRAEEIRRLNSLNVEELVRRSGESLLVLPDIKELHRHFANSIAWTVASNNAASKSTALILPYGPTGQYPLLKNILNREGISLKDASLFFMDEQADAFGETLPSSHPLSFKGGIEWLWQSLEPN